MSSDPVRRLVQSPFAAPRVQPVDTDRCDECRDEVPATTLLLREPWGLICRRCEDEFTYLREHIFEGGF